MKRSQANRPPRVWLVMSLACSIVVSLVSGGFAANKAKGLATFQANVMNVTGGGARGTVLTIRIDRWSTEDERQELLDAIKTSADAKTRAQTREVPDALRDLKKTGLVSVSGGLGYPLRYAARFEQGERTTVVLATNRQIAFSEAGRSSMSMDYNVSMIVLELDAEGKGSGVLSVATEIRWNEQKQQLEPVVIDSQPARLENVRQTR